MMPDLEGHPPPTNPALADHLEKTSFDNDMEKFGNRHDEYPQPQQQRPSSEAERAVVRKLDWRVCLTFYLLSLGFLSFEPLYRKG